MPSIQKITYDKVFSLKFVVQSIIWLCYWILIIIVVTIFFFIFSRNIINIWKNLFILIISLFVSFAKSILFTETFNNSPNCASIHSLNNRTAAPLPPPHRVCVLAAPRAAAALPVPLRALRVLMAVRRGWGGNGSRLADGRRAVDGARWWQRRQRVEREANGTQCRKRARKISWRNWMENIYLNKLFAFSLN